MSLLWLLAPADLASDLAARTASTMRVQEILRLSLAPAFLLAAIGAVMNVMMSRLIWVADRIARLERRLEEESTALLRAELRWLERRKRLAQMASVLGTGAGLTICLVMALLFVSAFIRPQIGTYVALFWLLTMLLLIGALSLFVAETLLASRPYWRDGKNRLHGRARPGARENTQDNRE